MPVLAALRPRRTREYSVIKEVVAVAEAEGLIERHPSMKTVAIDDDVIVTNLAECKCFALNASASVVWKSIETPHTIDQICEALRQRFDIAAGDCRGEIVTLIGRWTELGLVRAAV